MRNILKKGLSVLLAFAMVFSSAYVGLNEVDFGGLFAVKTKAEGVDDLTFALTEDETSYEVSDCNSSASGEIVIPSTYNGLPVTNIRSYAFYNCTSLTSIKIPESVTSMGSSVFWNCTSLTSIEIPESITSIDYQAFYNCESLTTIEIPDSVTSIGQSAFSGCTSLTSIVIPGSVTSISNGAFSDCTSLTSIEIPDSVTSIGDGAFSGCTSLTSIALPEGIMSIGDYVFDNTGYYNNSENWEDDVLYIDNYLIRAKTSKQGNCVIKEGTKSIAGYAFKNCTSLTTIEIPDSVTSIGNFAFHYFSGLTTVEIPDSVTSIGYVAFNGCTSLTSVEIPAGVTSIDNFTFENCTSLTSVDLPDGITSIGDSAFSGCTSLTSVDLPDGITNIGDSAFSGCTSLTSVDLPDGITSIGDSTFSGCTSLTSIEIPDSVTSIGADAFYRCTSLTSIEIPDSVTSIGDDAFCYCTRLTSVYITDIAAWCNISFNNAYSNPLYYAKNLYINGELATEIFIPDSVTSIGNYAFSNYKNLTSIEISDSVTSIGYRAFYNTGYYNNSENWENDVLYVGNYIIEAKDTLSGEYSVKPGTKAIAYQAFCDCINLTSITLNDCLTSIGESAFCDCESLVDIIIPDSVTDIGRYAFLRCYELSSVSLGSGITKINDHTFYDCTYLTSITIPDGVTSIGESAFEGCSSLTCVTIPDTLTKIERFAFRLDYSYNIEEVHISDISSWLNIQFADEHANPLCYTATLYLNGEPVTDIVVPEEITKIGQYAFCYYENLASVAIHDNVTSIGKEAFIGTDYYKNQENWENGVLYISNHLIKAKSDLNGLCSIKPGVTVVADCAFEDCVNINSVVIPESVTGIGEDAFKKCIRLSEVYFAGDQAQWSEITTLNNIGLSLYSQVHYNVDTADLDNHYGEPVITIPDTCTTNGEREYTCPCGYKKTEEIPAAGHNYVSGICTVCNREELTDYLSFTLSEDGASYTIASCNSSVSGEQFIPAEYNGLPVLSIDSSAFYNCRGLTSIVIPDSIISIGENAFENCYSLYSIIISDNVSSIGEDAFYNTGYYNNSSNWENSVLYIGNHLIKADTYLSGQYLIKEGTKTIAGFAFCNCTGLDVLVIPDSVTNINTCAFFGWITIDNVFYEGSQSQWSEVVVGGDNQNVTNAPFHYNVDISDLRKHYNSLTIITPSTCTTNGEGVYTCPCGYEIRDVIPATGHSYSNGVCSSCGREELKDYLTFTLNSDGSSYTVSKCDASVSGKHIIPRLYNNLPVTDIGGSAFLNCTKLTSITIPEGIKTIGASAFYGCTNLATITIPDSVTGIGMMMCDYTKYYSNERNWQNGVLYIGNHLIFAKRTLTGKCTVKDGTKTIADGAFRTCSKITSVVIPKSMKNICYEAFNYCDSLKYIFYKGTSQQWDAINIEYMNASLGSAILHCEATDHTSSSWKIDKKATTDAAGKKHKECTVCKKTLKTEKIPQLKCSAPKISKAENTTSGVKITWGKVSGADKYKVYRSTKKSSGYEYIGATSKTAYTDKKAKSGTTYYYKVKAVNEAGDSSSSSAKSVKYLADPTLSTPKSTKKGVTLKWSKVSGAQGYIVYRKTGSGSYSKLATVKGSTKVTYTDKSAKKGKKYTYKVKAYYSKTYSAYSNTKTITDKY